MKLFWCILLAFLAFSIPSFANVPKLTTAQNLNHQGNTLFEQGKIEAALTSWQESEQLYSKLGDITGKIGTQLNQAKAWQSLGFYQRSHSILKRVSKTLNHQPDSPLKVSGLLNFGNILRLTGDFSAAQSTLQQGLELTQKLDLPKDRDLVRFQLGNLAVARGFLEEALFYYQQTALPNSSVRLPALVKQMGILIQLHQLADAQKLIVPIQNLLLNLPETQLSIYTKIEFAEVLIQLNNRENSVAAEILVAANQEAEKIGELRAQSYALGRLGHLYEQTQQWEDAKKLTQQAINIAEKKRADDIIYQWQWQIGRIEQATNNIPKAIANYTEAVNILQSLRQDLVAVNQDVQFSFRSSVEPVYRQLVDLLLQQPNQEHLIKARKTIEALQTAELANYFRQACNQIKPISVEKIDPHAAIIYPIILRDRIEVILSIPNQALHHYATSIPQSEVEVAINRMRQSMRQTSFEEERLAVAQQIYTWLIADAANQLANLPIDTLVFVLDGSLRNIPMAALHDGEKYLVEKYQIAIAPSLEIYPSQPRRLSQVKAVLAGISKPHQELDALPGVEEEIKTIRSKISATVLLNENFTVNNLQKKLKTPSVSILHLATHAQFSSQVEDTFILTWNQKLNPQQLNTLLSERELDAPPLDLLILSACQTAKGDNRATLGLAGVATRSGTRSTLASLWTVNDTSTTLLMQEFYNHLLSQKLTKSAALRQAQLYLLQQPEFKHPFHWASFIMVGNWL
ncbi:CHAT domain-containing protein [Calothrix sp. PCC 6303]|uniref:CHAT domain-containing protein n=1 Tax=Calothrix sp. PCC 6303 TaxID=1170562 RepID=UPI0002A01C8E|nr:CHAT domain-containing protein [Calothrix sp. PCC 6303]AFZ03083.1 Tetratricopeptide TPR_1 repeat-containing protein [Calothrix sp. PCC 6303]